MYFTINHDCLRSQLLDFIVLLFFTRAHHHRKIPCVKREAKNIPLYQDSRTLILTECKKMGFPLKSNNILLLIKQELNEQIVCMYVGGRCVTICFG